MASCFLNTAGLVSAGMGALAALFLLSGCGGREEARAVAGSKKAFDVVEATPRTRGDFVPPVYPSDEGATWTMLASGVRFRELAAGDGDRLTSGIVAYYHIRTFLGDGKFFHSTMSDRKPVYCIYRGGRLPAELEDALEGMRERGRRVVEFPGGIAYHSDVHLAAGVSLPPEAQPRFDVSLLFVKPSANAAAITLDGGKLEEGKEVQTR